MDTESGSGKGTDNGTEKGKVPVLIPCAYVHCKRGYFTPSGKSMNRTRNVQRFCSNKCRIAQWELEKFGKVRKGTESK